MTDKNTPKPVFSREEHYQKRQTPQRMVYHSTSSAGSYSSRSAPTKRVNYHAGAAGVYTRKTTERLDFSSQSSAASKRPSSRSWRTESAESLRQTPPSRSTVKSAVRSLGGTAPVFSSTQRISVERAAPPLSKPEPRRSGAASDIQRHRPASGSPAREREQNRQQTARKREAPVSVPWFQERRQAEPPVQTETVLEPIDSGKTKGKTLFFPTIQPEDVLQHNFEEQECEPEPELESEPEREPAPKPRRTKAAPAKKQEKPKPKKKKKKRKSAWKRWQEAREEKRRNAPPKTPEQLKRIKTLKKIGAVSFATMAVLICAFVTSFYLFKIETVNVVQPESGTAYQDEQIKQAFGTPVGNNLFGYSAQKVAQSMTAALPYLETVDVRRVLPNRVDIEVTPAVETYQIESAQGGWVVCSLSQKVLRLAEQPQEAGLITIRGVKASNPVPGVMVAFEEPDKQAMFTQIMQQIQAKGLTPINEVDLTDPLEMNILYAGRLRIVLGTINDIAYKVDWAWRLVTPQLEESLKETAVGILDVSSRTEEGRGKASYLAGSTEIVHDVQEPAADQPQEITDPQAVSEPAAPA